MAMAAVLHNTISRGVAGAHLRCSAGMSCPLLRLLVAGPAALVLTMGIGRFAYTPILPLMQRDLGLGDALAGALAAANNAGYLAGALGAGLIPLIWRGPLFRLALIASVATTALSGFSADPWTLGLLRFGSGLASGAIFVQAGATVLDALRQAGRASWGGVHFAGVGLGIALSGAVVLALAEGDWRLPWYALGGLGVLLALPCWAWLSGPSASAPAAAPRSASGPMNPRLAVLHVGYFADGLGYVVTATFLSSLLARVFADVGVAAGAAAWIVVGLAGAPSSVLWSLVGARVGIPAALGAAFALQALGVVLPLAGGVPSVVIGAALFGGTFIAITALTLARGAAIADGASARVASTLTVAFGLGQIIGPVIAGIVADASGSLAPSLWGAAAVLIAGGAASVWGAAEPVRPSTGTSPGSNPSP
jgi:predicted MFS family arabinose efflux permease